MNVVRFRNNLCRRCRANNHLHLSDIKHSVRHANMKEICCIFALKSQNPMHLNGFP